MSDTPLADTRKLIAAALERSPDDRERFLTEHADPGLSESIAALLRRSDRGAPLDGGGAASLVAGSRVGPYVVLQRLGRGGMGEVFLGRDPRLDRPVALKCLLASSEAGHDLRARALREARAAARITHPHVAAVHDVVEHEGRAFIVMEYVEGESLAVLLKRDALPPSRVLEIGRQLAAALAAAHAGGIIHRDLKPANVQVTPDGTVKILDFGIAVAFATLASGTTRTALGVITSVPELRAGTPAYMSPEQLLGRGVDERSDLFSLAVVLFEMATGRRPVQSTDPLEILLADIRTLPRADATARAIPPRLADVIAKGLAADPRDRFQSAAEMGAALDSVRADLLSTGTGTGAHPPRREASWAMVMARLSAMIVLLPAILWTLGMISSVAFNATLERSGAFAAETLRANIAWGSRSLVAPLVYAALATTLLWAIRFVLRLVALSPPIDRRLGGAVRRLRGVARTLALDDPIVSAQGLAALGIAALGALVWRFNGLIRAWGANVSTAPPEQLWRLGPDNEPEKILYRMVLTVLFVAFSAGLVRVLQLRARLHTRGGAGPLAALAAIVLALLLLNEMPYRILWGKSLRVEYQGMPCYAIGEHDARWLLYCPRSAAPRNRIVAVDDPAARPTGVTENIFTPLGQ